MLFPRRTRGTAGGLALLLTLSAATPALAHALGAECRLRGTRVEVEAYYDDDTPARNAHVRVLDARQSQVAQGRTDAQGRWSFPAPVPGSYQVLVNAGAGHRTTVRMTVPVLPDTSEVPGTTVAGGSPGGKEDQAPEETAALPLGDGPSREEFTRFPWLRVGLGLAVIAALSLALWFVKRVVGGTARRSAPGTVPERDRPPARS